MEALHDAQRKLGLLGRHHSHARGGMTAAPPTESSAERLGRASGGGASALPPTARFSLLSPGQGPEYPTTKAWTDVLRWALAVMDPDDRDLAFLASLLSHAAERGGLKEKQAKYANRSLERLIDLWRTERLLCQGSPSGLNEKIVTLADHRPTA